MKRSFSRAALRWTAYLLGALILFAPLHVLAPAAEAGESVDREVRPELRRMFTNPLTRGLTPSFADPTVIRGRDGYWYAYATTAGRYKLPIIRSRNLVDWELVGSVFTPENEPRYDGRGDRATRLFWAPAIYYFNGRYVLYYTYVVNAGSDQSWRAIGVATAPTPAGPWTDAGAAVVPPGHWEPWPGVRQVRSTIDPELVTTPDGTRYLFWGSRGGGVFVVQLSEDGLHTIGEHKPVAPALRYEAASVVRRDGYYYLFLSAIGGCCAGPVSAYPVHVARAEHPLDSFADKDGHRIDSNRAGGTPVQAPNGNRWVSVGHSDVVTDLSGQDWLVTHGIDRFSGDPNRHLIINRLDWIDGWPTTWAGEWAADGPVPAPFADALVADAFEGAPASAEEGGGSPGGVSQWEWRDGWRVLREAAGGYLHAEATGDLLQAEAGGGQAAMWARRTVEGDLRVRGFVRLDADVEDSVGGSAGFVLSAGGTGAGAGGPFQDGFEVRAVVDRSSSSLVVEAASEVILRASAPLPAAFDYDDWHELTFSLRGGRLHAEVSDAGRHDPVAAVDVELGDRPAVLRFGLIASGAADFDDVTVAPLYVPVEAKVPDPEPGVLDSSISEEFDGPLSGAWRWVREPVARVDGGRLLIPVQNAELIDSRPGAQDTASVLLRDLPDGEWIVETKVTVPFGDLLPRNWPQAGLVVYGDDDNHVTLTLSARGRPRWVSFGKETTQGGAPADAWAALGPVADTVWLRLHHTYDERAREHRFRAAVSVDGETWVWHGVRALPASMPLAIGLAAFGGDPAPTLVAAFEYLRFFRPAGSIWVSSPAPGEAIGLETPVRIEAVGVDPVSVKVLVDGAPVYSGPALPSGLALRAADYEAGAHWLDVEIVGRGGETYRHRSRFLVAHVRIEGERLPDRWRGQVPVNLEFSVDPGHIDSVSAALVPILAGERGEPIPITNRADVNGGSAPAPVLIDTLQFPDGPYDLDVRVTLRTGAASTERLRIVIDNFEVLEDAILAPRSAGWFGTVDRLKTLDRSPGWRFWEGDAGRFFGDGDRAARGSGDPEYLIWRLPRLYDFEFVLYTRRPSLDGLVQVEVSADGGGWRAAPFAVELDGTNEHGWTRSRVRGRPVLLEAEYVRLVFQAPGGQDPGAPDDVQLGHARLRGLR